jgi:hypothetical protein
MNMRFDGGWWKVLHVCSFWIMRSGNWALWGMFHAALGVRIDVHVLTMVGDAVFADPCTCLVFGIIV